jgi:GDPmannose 4,6-dehydratase
MSRARAGAAQSAEPPGGAGARRALLTGLTGQDGSFLAELLLENGYEVTGLIRRSAADPLGCAEHLRERVKLVQGDLLQPATLRAAIEQVRPSEIYHLAAPSFVPASWERPAETIDAIVGSATAILEAVRDGDLQARVLICASGSIYGETPESPQNEQTPARPATPYAVAKLAAHQLAGVMRAHSGLHVSSAITYNHESERRPERFVTRRITRGAAAISLGLQSELALGSLEAVRDWSFAGDVVRGEWSMLQQDDPGDYVLASGVGRTVAEFAAAAFACLDLDAERFLRVDSSLVRPPERTPNVGDPSKAKERLGWEPRVSFEALVARMVDADLRSLRETRVRS